MKIINKAVQFVALIASFTNNAAATSRRLDDNKHPLLNKVEPFGYQSTQSKGHDIASSITPASKPHEGYFMTGTTTGIALSPEAENALHIGMHCYAMQVKPFAKKWAWVKKFGAYKNGVPTGTTCTSIATLDRKDGDTSTKVVVAGYTEGDEMFNPETGILPFSAIEADEEIKELEQNSINGFVLVLEIDDDLAPKSKMNSNEIKLIGGKMLTAEAVQYPVKVVAIDDTDIAVVSLVTDDGSLNLQARLQQGLGEVGDFEPIYKYGNFFNVQLQRFSLSGDSTVMERIWHQTFDTDDGRGAHVTSLVYDKQKKELLFAGTTHGKSKFFGEIDATKSNGSDFDGYITKVVAENGLFDETVASSATRIETNPGKDVFINGLCTHGEALYIVGSTNSVIDPTFLTQKAQKDEAGLKMNAFIQKRNLQNMKTLWTRQLDTADISGDIVIDSQDVEGMGCAIAHEANLVYMTGTVHAGASVVASVPGTGENDAFINAYDFLNGNLVEDFPLTQIGSVNDDFVAKDGGGVTIDEYGNAVLFGTTSGSLVKEKDIGNTAFAQSYSDIFLMSFLVDSAEHVPLMQLPGDRSVGAVRGMRKAVKTSLISVFSVLGAVVIFAIAFTAGKRRTTEKIEHDQEKDIARYLEEFEGGAKGSNANGNSCDVNGYYGNQNLAVGKDSDKTEMPGEVSFNSGAKEDSKTTYDELMESYKNIQKDLSDDAAGTEFVINKPNPEHDTEVV